MLLIDDLVTLGFSRYEAKAYAALQELGEAKTGKLCERSGIPSSHIYNVMDALIAKGLSAVKIANATKIFVATPPATLSEYLATKAKETTSKEQIILKQLTLLKTLPKQQETATDYRYFEGVAGIKALFHTIDEQMRQNSRAEVLSARTETWEKLDAFLLEHHKTRVKKNVHERMILPTKGRKKAAARQKLGHIEIRYLDHDNEAEYGVFGDLVAILYHGSKTPRGLLIKDALFAQTFKNIFEMLWLQAKQ